MRFSKSPAPTIILMAVSPRRHDGMWEETLGFFALMVPLVLAPNMTAWSRCRSSFGAGPALSPPP
jgi:hypothetical protein